MGNALTGELPLREEFTWAISPLGAERTRGSVPCQSADLTQGEPIGLELTQIFARLAEGDQEAFSLFYDLMSGMVFGIVLRVVRSRAIAEEVTQEVFLQAWEKSGSFDPDRGSVKAWVATLAHRRAVDAVRRSQSARDREERVPNGTADPDVADRVVLEDEWSRVSEALSGLTEKQAEAIRLAYYGGLTYREVAELQGTPLGTVKSRMRDGLLKLRETLGDDHG